jgi:hypothetical protein
MLSTFEKRKSAHGTKWSWQASDLRDLLLETVVKSPEFPPMTIFIDGLDHCESDVGQDIVEKFQEILNRTQEAGRPLRLFFASQPYPALRYSHCRYQKISTTKYNQKDIQNSVDEKLLTFTEVKKPRSFAPLRGAVAKRAGDVFPWAVLIVNRLNKQYVDGFRSPDKMLIELQRIPQALGDV